MTKPFKDKMRLQIEKEIDYDYKKLEKNVAKLIFEDIEKEAQEWNGRLVYFVENINKLKRKWENEA